MGNNEETRRKIDAMKNKIEINQHEAESEITINEQDKNKVVLNQKEDPKKVKLSKYNLMTPDEQAQFKAQQKANGEEEDNDITANLDRGDASRAQPDFKNEKLIEYTDIIDFLFKEVMVAGLNYAGSGAVNIAAFLAGYVADKGLQGAGWVIKDTYNDVKGALSELLKEPENASNQPDSTSDFRIKIGTVHGERVGNFAANIATDSNKKVLEGICGIIRRGEFGSLKCFSPETMEIMKKFPPEALEQLFSKENSEKMTTNMMGFMQNAEFYSSYMATTKLLTAKAESKNAFVDKNPEELFDQYRLESRKEFINMVNQEKQDGKNIFVSAVELQAKSLNAFKHIVKELNDGHYDEKGAKPAANKDFDELKTMAENSKDAPYSKEVGLAEMAGEMLHNQEALQTVQQNLKHREDLISARKQAYQARRANFQQMSAKLGLRGANKENLNDNGKEINKADLILNAQRLNFMGTSK